MRAGEEVGAQLIPGLVLPLPSAGRAASFWSPSLFPPRKMANEGPVLIAQ